MRLGQAVVATHVVAVNNVTFPCTTYKMSHSQCTLFIYYLLHGSPMVLNDRWAAKPLKGDQE